MSALPDQERRTRYSPTVGTLNFPVGFVIYDDDDVAVFHDGVEIDASFWSVTASYVKGESSDAVVVVDDPAGWANVVVDIVGRRRPRRVDQYIDGKGIPANIQNLILNEVVAALRELYDLGAGALRGPPGETVPVIPSAAMRAGLVLAFDVNGSPEASDLVGSAGWSPAYAIVADSARRVFQLIGYVGGEGMAPTDDIGMYVGASGYVSAIGDGVDIRGAQGTSGAGTGDMLAANNLADLDDAPTARMNLGLGTAAVADLGTTHAQAAFGDHTHDTRYYTQAQVTAAIAAATPTLVGDTGSGGAKGLVPAPASGDAAAGKFLKADGTFAVPPGVGGWTQIGSSHPTTSGTGVTITDIPGGYSELALYLVGVDVSGSGVPTLALSADNGANFSTPIQLTPLTSAVTDLVTIGQTSAVGLPKYVLASLIATLDATTGAINALKAAVSGGAFTAGAFTLWGRK